MEAHSNKAMAAVLLGNNNLVAQVIDEMNAVRLSASPELRVSITNQFSGGLSNIASTFIRINDPGNALVIYRRLVELFPDAQHYKDRVDSLSRQLIQQPEPVTAEEGEE